MIRNIGFWQTLAIALGLAVLAAGCRHTGVPSGNLFGRWMNREPEPAKTAEIDPTPEPNAQQKLNIQATMARSMEQKGQTDQAMRAYQVILEKDPERADVHHRLAVLYDRQGESAEAEEHYKAALQKRGNDPQLLCDYGYNLYLQRRWGQSESALCQALALDPRLARAHNNLALLLARTERHDQALHEFAQAGCSEAEARTNLGYVLLADKQWPQAQEQFELALACDPASPRARQGLARLPSPQRASKRWQ